MIVSADRNIPHGQKGRVQRRRAYSCEKERSSILTYIKKSYDITFFQSSGILLIHTNSLFFVPASSTGDPKYTFPPSRLAGTPLCASTTALSPMVSVLLTPT